MSIVGMGRKKLDLAIFSLILLEIRTYGFVGGNSVCENVVAKLISAIKSWL